MITGNLAQALKTFGINAVPYKRSPAGKDTFIISILPKGKEGVIQVNQGKARVEIHGSVKNRQAVLTVTEEPRVITRRVTTSAMGPKSRPPDMAQAKSRLRDAFPISMPGKVRYTFADVKTKRPENLVPLSLANTDDVRWNITGTVTAKAGKRTEVHFLVGVDESHNFVAPLPQKAASVEEAHRILKPKLRKNSLRQGEWFFEPLTKGEAKEIEQVVYGDGHRVKPLQLGDSTHTAQSATTVTTKKRGKKRGTRTVYARGYVTDSRKGRHSPLFLPTWHKAVRNREIVFKRPTNQSRRSQSWD